ncbi:hypothetical protein MKW94_029889 [Papaver nudicaule]|uniref:Uncharacterized protein n=1 Tax=Papaver nudicaule TaxID=74823 RepID=A0AA41SB64_PAPNU|nr:hypothetical protein [Papaver nudicaule]
MCCSNCKTHFCYKCGNAYETGKPLCCPFFDNETIRQQRQEREAEELRWQRRREAQRQQDPEVLLRQERRRLNELRILDPANHAHSCPMCRQTNAKVGNNNHIFCWSCQKHYCYLCRVLVKRSSQHYGPKGCKQHSTG